MRVNRSIDASQSCPLDSNASKTLNAFDASHASNARYLPSDPLRVDAGVFEWHASRPRTVEIHYDLEFDALAARLGAHGARRADDVFVHVVNASASAGGVLGPQGAGPNFDGGLISLCACNHGMRASLDACDWPGRWVAGFTTYSGMFGHQQYLRYLMRVGEAYASQHELVSALVHSGRADVVDAKDASRHASGDVWRIKPGSASDAATGRWRATTYCRPVIGHAHREDVDDETWHKDIEYVDQHGRRAALLVGDPRWSFVWNQPFICKTDPGPLRGHRRVSVTALLKHLRASAVAT
ncbi:hypothetical protein D7S86_11870 [Pararobbsia silviterrae]|uniref:Uncharacterized protein n=1 Tax=Pararobbsia silviterrae TaxID=1792498 RepID=A0A494XZD6_9BURK|nr:hypothetical protein D7S86_11870 [Pararobbsia silviterrae]